MLATNLRRLIAASTLAIGAAVAGGSAQAAGFDCTKAGTWIEKAICADKYLSAMDSELTALFRRSIEANARSPETVASLRSGQRDWLKQKRDACKDAVCLVSVYEARVPWYRIALDKLGIDVSDIPENVDLSQPAGAGGSNAPAAAKPSNTQSAPAVPEAPRRQAPPKETRQVVARSTPAARGVDRLAGAATLAGDPAQELYRAWLSLSGQCLAFKDPITSALANIARLRDQIRSTPGMSNDPMNSVEMTARQHAETHLRWLQQNGCAGRG